MAREGYFHERSENSDHELDFDPSNFKSSTKMQDAAS
jgi:hypothetical protein